jgi:hypothetical protein
MERSNAVLIRLACVYWFSGQDTDFLQRKLIIRKIRLAQWQYLKGMGEILRSKQNEGEKFYLRSPLKMHYLAQISTQHFFNA